MRPEFVSSPTRDLPTEVSVLLDLLPDLRIFRALALAPTAFKPWLAYGAALLSDLSLDTHLRELVILRTAAVMRCDYELAQHEAIAAALGVTPEQIEAALDDHDEPAALGPAGPVLAAVTELIRSGKQTGEVVGGLMDVLGERATVEVILVVGWYVGVALFANALGLEPDTPAQTAVVDLAAATREARS